MLKPKNTLCAALISLSSILPATAQELSVDLSGRGSLFGKISEHSATDLVPNPHESKYTESLGGAFGMVKLKLDYDQLRFATQVTAYSERNEETEFSADEAYAELLLGESSFVYIGRRVLSYGQSYGLNPTDIFRDPLTEKSIFSLSHARNDVKGVDLIGTDILFANGKNISFIYVLRQQNTALGAQKNFGLLRYSGFTSEKSLDYDLSLFGGNRPGTSASCGQGIGDASVLYIDAALRKGREKQTISGTSPSGILFVEEPNESHRLPSVTAGFSHTFKSGLSINTELTYDANGYSDQEWESVITALNKITTVQSNTYGQSLAQLNGLLNHYTLRRHYGFLRLFSDTLFSNSIDSELTVLHGFDDNSGSVGLRFEIPMKYSLLTGFYTTRKYGKSHDEFMLRAEKIMLSAYITMNF